MLMDLRGGHGRNMGAAGIAIGLGTAMGAPIGGQLAEIHPTTPLAVASVLMVGTAVFARSIPDRVPTTSRETVSAALKRLRARPELSIPYAFGFIDRLTAGFFALVGTLYFQSEFGLDPGATGIMLMLFFAPFALLQYPMGKLSDRIGRFVPIVVGSVCYGVTIVAVGLAPSVPLAAVAMVAVGVGGAFVSPATMALVTDIAGDGDRGVAMAGFNAAGSLGFLTGFLVGGGLADRLGFTTAFAVTGLLEIAIALVAFRAVYRLGDRIGRESARTDEFEVPKRLLTLPFLGYPKELLRPRGEGFDEKACSEETGRNGRTCGWDCTPVWSGPPTTERGPKTNDPKRDANVPRTDTNAPRTDTNAPRTNK